MGEADFAARVWEHSNSGICAVDADGALVLINAAARRTLGGSCASAQIGMPCEQALADYPALARLLREALAGRPALSRAELCAERADGERRVLGLSLTSLPDAAGAIGGAAVVFRDLAPIERSGERERLQQRLAALGEMAAGIAHEMRNPLAGMEVLAGLLQRRLRGDPDSLGLVIDLRSQVRQLSDTVTASLDYLRPLALHRGPVDPIELAEEGLVLGLARAPRPERVDRSYSSPLPMLDVDRQLLGVALVNLIVNACEAMAESGGRESRLAISIDVGGAPELTRALRLDREVRATADPGEGPLSRAVGSLLVGRPSSGSLPQREVRIAVGDSGPGIPAEIRDRIFDPFFTTRESGSGIGLANVQKIVHAHGGSLTLESSERGSVFRLHLPLAAEPT
ncbi:MAG TPA: ATP-binding protein [Myxococcota bacterium]|nr:ATP-binding protein [Myxococcota bacterium]